MARPGVVTRSAYTEFHIRINKTISSRARAQPQAASVAQAPLYAPCAENHGIM
jgi:hypothetical protein